MYHVVEVINGIVTMAQSNIQQKDVAEEHAQVLCHENGIKFEGSVSCDNAADVYSVQIISQ